MAVAATKSTQQEVWELLAAKRANPTASQGFLEYPNPRVIQGEILSRLQATLGDRFDFKLLSTGVVQIERYNQKDDSVWLVCLTTPTGEGVLIRDILADVPSPTIVAMCMTDHDAELTADTLAANVLKATRGRVHVATPTQTWAFLHPRETKPGPPEPPPPTPPPAIEAAPPPPDVPSHWSLLGDRPIDRPGDDIFKFNDYARALFGVIDDPGTETPAVIAITAPWGAGKSSLGRLVEHHLNNRRAFRATDRHTTIWYNAWLHDQPDGLAAGLISEIVRKLHRRLPLWKRIVSPVPSSLLTPADRKRRNAIVWGSVAILALLLASIGFAHAQWVADLFGFALPDSMKPVPDPAKAIAGATPPVVPEGTGSALGLGIIPPLVTLAVKLISPLWEFYRKTAAFAEDPEAFAISGNLRSVRQELEEIVQRALPSDTRLVIFVDDLERCRAGRGVELLETLTQLLPIPRLVIVLMTDMDALAASAQKLYAADLDPSKGDEEAADFAARFGRRYVEKLIQLSFALPPPQREKYSDLQPREAPPAATPPAESRIEHWGHVYAPQCCLVSAYAGTLPLSQYRADANTRSKHIFRWFAFAMLAPVYWIYLDTRSAIFPRASHRPDIRIIPPRRALWAEFLYLEVFWVSTIGSAIILAIALLLGALNLPEARFNNLLFAVAILLPAISIAFIRGRARRAYQRIRADIAEAERASAAGELRDVDPGIVSDAGVSLEDISTFVRESQATIERSRFINASEMARDAVRTALECSTVEPRGAKLLINRVRLALAFQSERNATKAIPAAVLGRWCALLALEGRVGRLIHRDHGNLIKLEKAAQAGSLRAAKIEIDKAWRNEDRRQLEELLKGDPPLSNHHEALIQLGG